MNSCQTCQGQMLEYLYDLLETDERRPFEDHLSTCAECQAGLRQAQGQKDLLAAAVHLAFPQVQFRPPQEEPATVPMPARRSRRSWQRWALAAALLIGAVLVVSVSLLIGDYSFTLRTVQQSEASLAQLRIEMNETAEKIRQVPQERDSRLGQVKADIQERQVQVQLLHPANLVTGQTAEVLIQTTNGNGKPLDADLICNAVAGPIAPLSATARGPVKENQLQVQNLGTGNYRCTVPAELLVQPQTPLTLMVSASTRGGFANQVQETLPVAPATYVTHLTTDKPMYQPGEMVYFRSLTLERSSQRPARDELVFNYSYTTPTGARHQIQQAGNRLRTSNSMTGPESPGPDGQPIRGVGAGMFQLAEDAPGGEYVLEVSERSNRFPPQQRKFVVNNYQKPRLNKELDFNRKSYGVGEEVQALCKASRADGGPVKERPVEVMVQIDGKTYDARGQASNQPFRLRTDADGKVTVRFRLPGRIEKGQASLAVRFDDGGNTDTLVRTIPIVVKSLQVEFFPEGGDLVANLPNRVYFQARTPLGKPADVKGQLLEDGQALPVIVQTLSDDREPGVNQGMGRFEFTPRKDKVYQLRIESPSGIDKPIALPAAVAEGVVLRVDDGLLKPQQALQVRVQSNRPRELVVGVTCRDQLLGSADLLRPGQAKIQLNPGVGGVCKVTVYEKQAGAVGRVPLVPRAERLIYRQQAEQLHLVVKPDRTAYVPGQKVTLSLESLDEKEKPKPAVLMIGVVDKSVLTLADEKTARTMPTHFLLTSDIKKTDDLEYADFLLGPHPRAAEALDLLLGVHGWRRFTPARPPTVEAAGTPFLVKVSSSASEEAAKAEWLATNQVRQEALKQLRDLSERYQTAQAEAAQVREAGLAAASARLEKYQRFFEEARTAALPVLASVALLLLLAGLAITLGQSLRQALPCYGVSGACALLLLLVVGLPQGQKESGRVWEVAQVSLPDLAREELAEKEARDASAPATPLAALDQRRGGVGGPQPTNRAGMGGQMTPLNRPGVPEGAARFGTVPPPPMPAAKVPQMRAAAMPAARAGGAEAKGIKDQEYFFKLAPGFQQGQGIGGADPNRALDGLALKQNVDRAAEMEKMPEGLRRKALQGPIAAPRGEMDFKKAAGAIQSAMVVREYAHQRTGGLPEIRSDFAETLYWHPALVLPGGKSQVSFDLCDSVTSFQVTAFGHSLDGRLGAVAYAFDSRLPFTVQPKVPLEVTASDRIDLPLSISNNTDQKQTVAVTLENSQGLELIQARSVSEGTVDPRSRFGLVSGKPSAEVTVNPESAVRQLFPIRPTIKEGTATLTFKGQTKGFAADIIRMGFRVAPEGFPIVAQQSDLLEQTALARVTLPENWIRGTLKLQAHVYPSTLADLQKGLEGLLREPNGCFEQTSTSNYPNLLILDYLRESDQSKPNVEARARELLGRGYQKLVSFECLNPGMAKRQGYEWFGGTAPPHEALTAYGLLQFRDMARVQDVDRAMLERTRTYLLSRRDGKGGFSRNPRALDTFGRAPEAITNAYIVWALTESGPDDDLAVELKALSEKANESRDPYFLALVANSLINRARTQEGTALLRTVAQLQKEEGYLQAESTSITGSGGRDLQIETTALAVLGWLKANSGEFQKPVQRAIQWIAKQRGGYGGFGSTQSTILALKALIGFARANKRTAEAGELSLLVEDRKLAGRSFPAGVTETLTLSLDDAEKHLKPGVNRVRLAITGKNVFPYTLTWTYQTARPVSAENCSVKLTTALAKTTLTEGDLVRLNVAIENTSDKGQGMATAIVGIPAGLSLPEDLKQLREYIRTPEDGSRPQLGAFEIRGRELVLYWRDLAPRQKIELPIDLIARVPGEYSGPASRAYLYYNADFKHWIEPLTVTIRARE